MNISHPKRVIFIILLALFTFIVFLYFSRIPELNAKAGFDPSNIFEGFFTHNPLFTLDKEASLLIRIGKNTFNWIYANYNGMIFGILLGALAKSLFRYFQFQKKKGSFISAFMGLIAGTPLSICVNCAAPVMKGILSSKQKVFALSVMLSAPSMNFIVLTILFATLPFYLAFSKVLFNLLLILIILPLINLKLGEDIPFSTVGETFSKISENWKKALKFGLKGLFEDLIFIFIRTAPLMILASAFAGVLGTFIDKYNLQTIKGDFPTLFFVVLIGILLPVPIAVDILLVAALFFLGLDTNIILALLLTLGSSSIYSLSIVWRSLSALWAIALFLSIFTLTIVMAPMGKFIEKAYIMNVVKHYGKMLNTPTKSLSDIEIIPKVKDQKQIPIKKIQRWELVEQQDDLSLYTRPFEKQDLAINKKFTKLEGEEIGLIKAYEPGNNDLIFPFWFRGVASGDINQDGWEDLVFGSNQGPVVYKNIGGKFQLQPFSFSEHNVLSTLDSLITFVVALVDFNNDNFPELFFTTWSKGNWLVPNIKGILHYDLAKKVPNRKAILTISAAFSDFDRNGYADIVNGNTVSSHPLRRREIQGQRKNSILYNRLNFKFMEKPLESFPDGDTLSTLVVDFNRDGLPDILSGNDFRPPDFLYLNKGKHFETFSLPSIGITEIPRFSMSHNLGDFNNDLIEDILLSGTIGEESTYAPSKKYTISKWGKKKCSHIKNKERVKRCFSLNSLHQKMPSFTQQSYHFLKCLGLNSPNLKRDCLANNLFRMFSSMSFFDNSPPDCNLFPKRYETLKDLCEFRLKASLLKKAREINPNLLYPKQHQSQYIYIGQKNPNLFQKLLPEKAGEMIYPKVPGWTWNSQIADYDNDGLQDIFLVNGSLINERNGPNFFLKNTGEKFLVQTFEYNLNDLFNYYSYVPIDFDNDGDLDIITNSSEGPVRVYKNNHSGKNSLSIRFFSKNGNENFISTQTILRGQTGKKKFMRRVQKSGGFLSFPSNQLYFGLGKGREKFSAEIIWPSGKKSYLNNKMKRGHQYLIIKN